MATVSSWPDDSVDVVSVNVPDVLPGKTVTVDGTVTLLVFAEERVTVCPPLGAALVRMTFPVGLVPPTTGVGMLKPDTATPDAVVAVDAVGYEVIPVRPFRKLTFNVPL